MWFYLDWAVDALNRNPPYDRCVIEQIAGDLLPEWPERQLVATGYLGIPMVAEEGGADPEQIRMEALFGHIDATEKGILASPSNALNPIRTDTTRLRTKSTIAWSRSLRPSPAGPTIRSPERT